MAVYDLADPDAPLPPQMVFDSSFLLALRPADDNPQAAAIQAFVRPLRPYIRRLLWSWIMGQVASDLIRCIILP